jgi:hypothetical protein
VKKKHKFHLIAIIVSSLIASATLTTYATIGDTEICVDAAADNASGVVTIDANDLYGQTFTPASSLNVGAVKMNWRAFGNNTDLNVYIVGTSSLAPDMTNVLGTTTIAAEDLPLLDFTPPTDNPYSCNPNEQPTQIAEFASPIALSGSTLYAIIIEYNSGTSGTVAASPYTVPNPGSPEYSGGLSWECNSGSCSRNTPATWDILQSQAALSFTVYDNISQTQDAEITNFFDTFLSSMGMNSPAGRIIVGSFFTLYFFLILAKWGVPWIVSLGLTGLFTTMLTAGLIFDPAILLGLIAIIGVASMGLIFSLVLGGDKGQG